ncbi:MAG: hypothetical protein L0Y74_06360, partial [candidate division Zixibacteria bacterium]|nr:hypothetical protein [candidate division Zixibacteria bacterium]
DFSIADIISAVNYYFNKPGWPACDSNSTLCWLSDLLCRGDWNGNGTCSVGDVIHGANYVFNKPGNWLPVSIGACCLAAN